MTTKCTTERFLKDAKDHRMTIIRDDGVNRHIRFRQEKSSAYWFDLITWPGALCIDGDMGTFVFKRLHDMFEFFRDDRSYAEKKGLELDINRSYWSEKLVAPNSRHAKEYSADKFRQHVKEAFDEWVTNHQPDAEYSTEQERNEFTVTKVALWDELSNEVLNFADDGGTRAYDAANEFESAEAKGFSMNDCWEWNCLEYTFHFLWCCYAIAWGLKQYDDATQKVAA